jgi:hypothetical protein
MEWHGPFYSLSQSVCNDGDETGCGGVEVVERDVRRESEMTDGCYGVR